MGCRYVRVIMPRDDRDLKFLSGYGATDAFRLRQARLEHPTLAPVRHSFVQPTFPRALQDSPAQAVTLALHPHI